MTSRLVTRREALAAGVAAAGGVMLGGCSRPLPPTYGSVLRLADNFTYVAHRTLLPGESLVRDCSRPISRPSPPSAPSTRHRRNAARWPRPTVAGRPEGSATGGYR